MFLKNRYRRKLFILVNRHRIIQWAQFYRQTYILLHINSVVKKRVFY